MSILIDRAREALERANLLGKGLLVALSGGVDSVCLVRVLREIAADGGGRLEAAHVDHGLRLSSARDAAFCAELARELCLPFHLERLEPGELRAGRGQGVQAEARRRRRHFFEQTLARRGLDAVALGHHADDQAETILFRLIRGVGPRGVRGMVEWTPPYVRPFLGVRRAEIESLARARQWAHREDPTNRKGVYRRNRIRLEAMPLLRSIHPRADEALLRFARLAQDDERVLTDLAREALHRLAQPEPEGFRIPLTELSELPRAVRRRLYLAAWEAAGSDPGRLEAVHLEAVESLLASGRTHRVAPTPGPGSFARSYGDLWVLAAGALEPPKVSLQVPRLGRVRVQDLGVELVWGEDAPSGVPSVGVAAGRGQEGLTVRTWRAGDRLDPGTGREVKVKDLLMDARVALWRRRRSLVVADGRGSLGLLSPEAGWSWGSGEHGWVWAEGLNRSDSWG